MKKRKLDDIYNNKEEKEEQNSEDLTDYEDFIKQENVSKKQKSDKPFNYNKWSILDNTLIIDDLELNNISEDKIWVSASRTRNYLLNDPFIDWLELYYNKNLLSSKKKQNLKQKPRNEKKINCDFLNMLFKKGNDYEQEIFTRLDQSFPEETITICQDRTDFFNRDNYKKTIKAMEDKIPIIKQAMLINNNNKTFGVADLLIRNDYLEKITTFRLQDKVQTNFKHKYYYVVIDIKWSEIHAYKKLDGISNASRIPAYKGQLAVYNLALGHMQGYIPDTAYIWAKQDKMGKINYSTDDKFYIEKTRDAINWIRELRLFGHDWDCYNPNRPEMYPNMTCSNTMWDKIKQQIAEKNKELTLLWNVGVKNRNYAHSKNIFTWDDSRCSAKNLNINGAKVAPILDKIIEVNRNSEIIIMPENKKLENNDCNWQKKTKSDLFIDFETFNDCFFDEKELNYGHSNVIFMIGVTYYENNNTNYKYFVMNEYTIKEEERVISEFITFVNKFNRPKLYHWSHAEYTMLKGASKRHKNKFDKFIDNSIFIDFYKIFKEEPVVIKDMFDFSLKSVAKAMTKHNLINLLPPNVSCQDGLMASTNAIKYYTSVFNNQEDNFKIICDILEYNKYDCDVLQAVVDNFR
jgi:hypothetical protein